MVYDVIIIGAGSAALFAGIKLTAAGKKVLVIERQPFPGGLATTFTRKGFTFESSVHCVDVLGPGREMRVFLKHHGIDRRIGLIELEDFSRIIYPEHDFVVDFDPQHFKDYLKKNFPSQVRNIDRLFAEFERFYREFDRFSSWRIPLWLQLSLSPLLYASIIKMSCLTVRLLIRRHIHDQKLEAIIASTWGFAGLPPSRLSALYFLLVFEGYYYGSTAYVRGGFVQLFKAMAEKIREAGGEVRFNTTVTKILTEGKIIKGVVTDKKEEFYAKTVISNANAIDTLTQLLDDEALRYEHVQRLRGQEKSISAFQVYLGLRVPAKGLGMDHSIISISTTYNHEDNFQYSLSGDYERCMLELVDHAQLDPTLVPQGKGNLLIFTLDNYANWKGLSGEEYRRKKKEVTDKLIGRVEDFLPGLRNNIELIEAATPLTIARYGLSPQGAIYGFAQSVRQSGLARLNQKTAVKGLFLAGAWTFPGGGVHGCFISGVMAADLALSYLRKNAHHLR